MEIITARLFTVQEVDEYNFHLHKVEAGVATIHERSIRVLEKVGMTREDLSLNPAPGARG